MEADFLVFDGVFCKETKRAPLTSRSASMQQREALMLGFLQEDLQVDNKTNVPIIFRYNVSENSPHYHIWENGHPLTGDHALTPHMLKILKIVQNYGNRS